MKQKHWLLVGGLFVLFLILTLAKSALYENYKAEHQIGATRFVSCGPLSESDPEYEFDIFTQQVGKTWKTVIAVFPREMRTHIAMRSEYRSSNRPFDEPNCYMIVRGNEHKLTMDHVYLIDNHAIVATVPMTDVFSQPFDLDGPFDDDRAELWVWLQKQTKERESIPEDAKKSVQ